MCKYDPFNSWKFPVIYTTPTPIVKAEPNQSVSSSLQTSPQRDHTSVQQAIRDTLELGYPGILTKTSNSGIKWSYAAGIADLRTKKPMKTDFAFALPA